MNEVAVIPKTVLQVLALRINTAQAVVLSGARTMLAGVREAGQALLEAKKLVGHGNLKAWIEANTTVSYEQARKYMRVAKTVPQDQFDPTMGINAFLDLYANHKPAPPPATPAPPSFDKDDAEMVQNIARRLKPSSNCTPNEVEASQHKLEKLAEEQGVTVEELIVKANELAGDDGVTLAEAVHIKAHAECLRKRAELEEILVKMDAVMDLTNEEFKDASRDDLLIVITNMRCETSGLTAKAKELVK